jgi:hypothetical protein
MYFGVFAFSVKSILLIVQAITRNADLHGTMDSKLFWFGGVSVEQVVGAEIRRREGGGCNGTGNVE